MSGISSAFDHRNGLNGFLRSGVEHPGIFDTNAFGMRAYRHAAVEAGEAVGAVEFDGSPLGVEAVDPVVAAEGLVRRIAMRLKPPGSCGVGEVALERELLHDGVADEFLVEEDLGAEAGSADVEEMRLPFQSVGTWIACPTRRRRGRRRSGGWGRWRRSGTLRGAGVLAEPAPVVLLDGGGEGDVDAGEWREETQPLVDR